MHIDWQTLGAIAVVAAAVTLAVVLLVAFALVGSSAISGRGGRSSEGGDASARLTVGGTALAALCLLAAGLIASYGLYLIIA